MCYHCYGNGYLQRSSWFWFYLCRHLIPTLSPFPVGACVGYARLVLLIAATFVARDSPVAFISLYTASVALDAFDGMAARALNQRTSFVVTAIVDMRHVLAWRGWRRSQEVIALALVLRQRSAY